MDYPVATLDALRNKCLERKERMQDEVVSVKSLLMDPQQPGLLIVRRNDSQERSYRMNGRVYSQAPGVVYGLPGSYLKKLVEGDHADPVLAAMNFNHWVKASKDKEVLLRFEHEVSENDDGSLVVDDELTVRAMLPASWNPIPYEHLITTLINKYGPEQEVTVTRFDGDSIVLDFISFDLNYHADGTHNFANDPVKWGMRVRDSDAGIGYLELCPFTLRIVCTNGATRVNAGVVMRISHSAKESRVIDQVMANVRQSVELIGGYSDRLAEQIVASHGIMLELNNETNMPEAAFRRLAREDNVTKLQDKYVREAWQVEEKTIKEPNVWRLHNAFTRAGTHADELTIDQRLHLQATGGKILEMATIPSYHWN